MNIKSVIVANVNKFYVSKFYVTELNANVKRYAIKTFWLMLFDLEKNIAEVDPMEWKVESIKVIHQYLYNNWDRIKNKDEININWS